MKLSALLLASPVLALGVKKPLSTWFNEAGQQQGGEGTEKYRVITSFSCLF
jgi:hypothetical protein